MALKIAVQIQVGLSDGLIADVALSDLTWNPAGVDFEAEAELAKATVENLTEILIPRLEARIDAWATSMGESYRKAQEDQRRTQEDDE